MNPKFVAMYIEEILWLLTWPALIIVSYWLSRFALKKFEEQNDLTDD